jgi:arsenical resistance protein ArsH
VGYHLAKSGISFQILDANQRIGDAWRNRWDSLRLFNPARYAGLPGMPFPARGDTFPTKDDVADYLESYAQHFHLPVQTGVNVDRVSKHRDGYVVNAGGRQFESDNVVVAMANYQVPRLPKFASELGPGIVQLHSHEYRNPSQLREGGVLIVGVGNSGADIGLEVARAHPTWMSGKETGHVPIRIESALWRFFLVRLLRFFGAEPRIFDPSDLPFPDQVKGNDHPAVHVLHELSIWSEGQVWCSPERHGAMSGIMKTQIDWIPLSLGAVRPTQGKTLAVMQVSGGSQSFNAVNQLRVLGRWMRMITIPNQASVAKAYEQFDEAGRMLPSSYYDPRCGRHGGVDQIHNPYARNRCVSH